MYVTRYITTKGEEKAEILHIFFSSVFNTTVILRVVSFLSWKAGMGSRIKNKEGNNDLLLHLDYLKSTGLDGIHPRALRFSKTSRNTHFFSSQI